MILLHTNTTPTSPPFPASAPYLTVNGTGAAETAKAIADAGGTSLATTADGADRAAIEAAATETRSKLGPITILVNNAGVAPFVKFLDGDDDDLEIVRAPV